WGMFKQIEEECDKLGLRPRKHDIIALRDAIRSVIEEDLSRAAETMRFIQGIAKHLLPAFVEWIGPSGFPVANRYRRSKQTRVRLPFMSSAPVIADEYLDTPRREKVINSIVANLVHSLDAAHLCRSINRAVKEDITDFMTIHDCYGTLAPDVARFARIRREEIAEMYRQFDPFAELLKASGLGMDLPERDLAFDLTAVGLHSTYFDR